MVAMIGDGTNGNVAIQPVSAGFVRTGQFDVNIFNTMGNLDPRATFGLSQTITSVPGLTRLNLTFYVINPDRGVPTSYSVFVSFDGGPATEVFNIFNEAHFSNPSGSFSPTTTTTFGQITSTEAPPTSPYGSFQSAAVTQRVLQVIFDVTQVGESAIGEVLQAPRSRDDE